MLAVGGSHLTSDIAHGLRLPADLAEKIKIEHGSASAADVPLHETFMMQPFGEDHPLQVTRYDLATIIEARVEEIFGLILQEIKRTGYDGLLPAGVVLTGGASQLPGIRKVASSVLNLPSRVAAPQNLIGLVDKLTGPAFSTSVGLLHWAQRESIAPPARKGKKKTRTIDLSRGVEFFKRLLP